MKNGGANSASRIDFESRIARDEWRQLHVETMMVTNFPNSFYS